MVFDKVPIEFEPVSERERFSRETVVEYLAFNNDILTRLIQPYVFDHRANICYIGTLNPGHRHRIATKSTLEFARNLRFCCKYLEKKRRRRQVLVEQ